MNLLSRGLLVAFEGVDGSGKSTLTKTVFDSLLKQQLPALLTKEPGGSPLGKQLRTLLQQQTSVTVAHAEFLLFAADRAQHFHEVIIPALKNNMVVISDRLADSSLVYQGFARGLTLSMLETVNAWAMQNIKPDITFYLKVDLATARERIIKRSVALTTFETDHQFLQKVIDGFNALYADRDDVIVLNGHQKAEVLSQETQHHINNFLKKQS